MDKCKLQLAFKIILIERLFTDINAQQFHTTQSSKLKLFRKTKQAVTLESYRNQSHFCYIQMASGIQTGTLRKE